MTKESGLRIGKVTFGTEPLDILLEKALSPYLGKIKVVKVEKEMQTIN